MEGNHHDLAHEFPELKEKIHEMKIHNSHFRNLYERYTELDKAVVRAEARIDKIGEDEEERMRMDRVKLKDELYAMLTSS